MGLKKGFICLLYLETSLPFNELVGKIPSVILCLRNLEVLARERDSIAGCFPGGIHGFDEAALP